MDLTSIIDESVRELGLKSLKEKQEEAVKSFLSNKDTFVALPTGYGKSIIYAVLPLVFDKIRGKLAKINETLATTRWLASY